MLTRLIEKLTALDRIDTVINASADEDGSVFAGLCQTFGLSTEIDATDVARLPQDGPVIYVCNHPSGFAEGLVVPALLDALRDDVATLALSWFARWPALAARMILVDPRGRGGSGAAMKEAVRHLRGGGALMMFPAGEVAHGRPGSFTPREKPWRHGLAALVRLTGATVVPVHAEIRNRRRFHALSWLHSRLGALMLAREVLAQSGRCVRLRVGRPLPAAELAAAGGPEEVTARCRQAVMDLAVPAPARAGARVPRLRVNGTPTPSIWN